MSVRGIDGRLYKDQASADKAAARMSNAPDISGTTNTSTTGTRSNTVSNPNTNVPTNTYGDTGGAANATKYTGVGVSSAGDYTYNPNINTSSFQDGALKFGYNAIDYGKTNPGYLEKRNNYIANALYNEGKTDYDSIYNYLMTFDDFKNYDDIGRKNTTTAIQNRMGSMINNQGNNSQNTFGTGNDTDLNSRLGSEIRKNYNNANKGYSDLMGGSNYPQDFDTAVKEKLQKAYGITDLNEFKNRYPEQYTSLIQALDSVRGVRDATDPNSRQMLDGALQGIIGTGVGAGSDWSKLNVLESSILNKFKDPDKIKSDAQNVVKLQTEGKNTAEIAKEMGISEDQVQQLILLANGLDSKAGEYYQLKDDVAKDITEPYDTKMQRLEEEKKIALDRANRNVERLKEDFDTNMERQKQQNDINLHNADFLAGQYGYGFSRRGIEGLNYTATQAQQIIDDLTKNYDRNNQEMADGIADIIRNWQWNNEDLMKASQDALTAAKNNFTSNMLAIQQQYGTVGLQAQQYLAQNVQSFIEQAETIYDNALTRQQQNLSNLITNVSNLNALAAQNLTLRQAKIEQFQSESMNLNRNQLQQLATQLGMDTASYQDLVNYQVQAVQNQLNGYVAGSGVQFQSQIQSLLDQGYTPTQAMQSIMNSADFKAAKVAAASSGDNRTMSNGIMYNKATGEYQNLNQDEYGTIGDKLYNKRTGQIIDANGNTTGGNNYVTSETVNGQTYGVSTHTIQGLQNFYSQYVDANGNIIKKGGQCGKFVNDYLESLGLDRVFVDPIDKKKAAINTPDGYTGQVGDVIIMDSPSKPENGHVAIITGVNAEDGTFQTLESNKNGEGAVFSRTIDPNKQTVYGYYHPDGAMQGGSALGEGGYDPSLTGYFENWFKLSKDDRASTLKEYGITQKEFNTQYNAYFDEKEKTEALENITKLRDTAQQLLDWNKKNSNSGPGSLHEGWADLETYKEGSYSYKGLWGLIQGKGQTKASEGIAMYNFLKNNQSLDKFLEAKRNGGTFGSMSNAEWQLIGGAASLLNWETNDKNFEDQLQDMIDEYDKAIAKIGGTGGSGKLKGTIDLASHGRL